ncbi:MAG: glycoside hydrolase family 9 protein [Bacteroidales bacterium]|nr:glycoside hydrolase family 9 protein [Bacteroidales bacterium]
MKKSLLPLAIFAMFLSSCTTSTIVSKADNHEHIRFNQLGYYPDAIKEFVVADYEATSFQILNEKGKKAFEGELIIKGVWESSGESILQGDFSALSKTGNYTLQLNTGLTSAPFEIAKGLYGAALDASIKSFYFQRASMAIEKQYGGIYKRASGHPDDHCFYHSSTGKEEGTLNSPGAWYDAGDYGKYVVNAAITVGQMLNLLEMVPDAIPTDRLNIPESGNGIRDLLDEIRYELDWVMTMQDEDGGVYHKLTALNFGGFIMPEDYDLDRYIIGKGTFSSLTFAAVLAQASRIYADIDPVFSSEALVAAECAWDWAVENSDVPFRNPEDVVTGQYGDDQFSDDFYWAAAELFISTGKESYLETLTKNDQPYIHQITNSWKFFIRNMGFHTLLINDKQNEELTKKHLALSDELLAKMESIPYGISIDHFEWGSNSDVLNQAMILCIAHHLSGEQKYLDGAIRNTDYIFGKNATGFSFLTGFGSKQVMNPHHRPSGADDIDEPVPGFILGGPNKDKQDRAQVEYTSDFPARSYADVEASYASNEVCLNWNAPAVFVLGYLEQVYK